MAQSRIELDGGSDSERTLRVALSLSFATGQAFRMSNIRPPGMSPTQVAAVGMCTAISAADVTGLAMGSSEFVFSPGPVRPGNYRFDVGALPATSLFQMLLWPLALASGPSTVTLLGATHAPDAPVFEQLSLCWLPLARRLGAGVTLHMPRAGFAPARHGELRAAVRGGAQLRGVQWGNPTTFDRFTGFAVQAGLGEAAADQEAAGARSVLEAARIFCPMVTATLPSQSVGGCITLVAGSPTGMVCASTLWNEGRAHAAVGEDAASALLRYINARAPVDPHTAEYLLIPLALASEPSVLLVSARTDELAAMARTIEVFLGTTIRIAPDGAGRARLEVEPRRL